MSLSSLINFTIRFSSGRFILIPVFILSLIGTESAAQWKKLFDFGSPVTVVYFKEFSSRPLDGFVGVNSTSQNPDKVWRTLDGGKTWNLAKTSFVPNQGYADAGCFTFKDSTTGWFVSHWDGPRSIHRTTDGGNTWSDLLYNAGISPSIYYVHSTNLLLCAQSSLDALPYLYSVDGQSFVDGPPFADFSGAVSIAFSDDRHGILSPPSSGHLLPMGYTQDGGLTWNKTDSAYESYQPIGIPGTTIFFAISEFGEGLRKLMRSDDGGINWYQTYLYPTHSFPEVTGAMQVGVERHLFFQTSSHLSEGIMMSSDTAKTFVSLCGPINDQDTRFYVRDSFIYAADNKGGLWLNTSGIGSNSTPQISNKTINFPPSSCAQDTIITLTFFDSCNGIQATLKKISISGSQQFALVGGVDNRTLHENDSVIVQFDPHVSGNDSALIHLTFHLGYADFDTTIQLFGSGLPVYTPQISSTVLNLTPLGCKPIDSVITLTFVDSCNNIQADLTNVLLLNGGKFSLVSGGNARHLHENDSIGIRYDPQASGADTAFLKLTFHLGLKDFDTTITLMWSGNNGVEHIGFSMGMPVKDFVGFGLAIPILPNRTISGRGLNSISFDLNYYRDLLGFKECASKYACATGAEIVNGKMTTVPVTITGNDVSLDSLSSLIDLMFYTYLTDTSSTAITMTNLKLNNGDEDYAQCVLSADTTSTSYSQILRCTEPTLQNYLQTKTILFITSMRPNPAGDNITLEISSAIDQDAEIEVFTILSDRVANMHKLLPNGNTVVSLNTHDLAAGMYVLRIKGSESVVSKSFLRQ